jgi:LL-diaminopimelate aminotransferase
VVDAAERLGRLPPFLGGAIRARIREARERGVDVISLGIGDPDGPTPDHVVDALCHAARDPAHHVYPSDLRGAPSYRRAVAEWYGRRFGVELDLDTEVISLIGSKEGNHHLALALLNPGDVALVPDPAYPVYESACVIAGAKVVRVPLHPGDGFLVDFDSIAAEVAERAKLLWISYPNNPTAAVAPPAFFERAVDFARRHRLVVVHDNPYSEITFDGVYAPSILEVDGAKDLAIEFTSFSKTYNMAGWRLGAAAGNPAVLSAVMQVKETADTCIFTALQAAAVAALEGPQDAVARTVAAYQRRRDLVVEGLRTALGLDVPTPKATFYVWAPAPLALTGDVFAARLLDRAGVVVTPGSGYGRQGEHYVRISLALEDARLAQAIERMADARPFLLDPADAGT